MADINTKSETPRRLSELLAQRRDWPFADRLLLVRRLAVQVQALHQGGRTHRAIGVDGVTVDENLQPQLAAAAASRCFGGEQSDPEFCPPELSEGDGLELPEEIEAAAALLDKADRKLDPRRIDVYQLGTLLCRLVTGEPILAYVYDPITKARVLPIAQSLLERALGYDCPDRFEDCQALIDALDEAIGQADSVNSPTSLHETPAAGSVLWTAADTPPTVDTPIVESLAAAGIPFEKLAHFRIVEQIGRGGMGDVYRAYDELLQQQVAVKVLPPELARDKDYIRRFNAEATATANLDHPNIVPVYYIGEDDGHQFFAMRFIEGETLTGRLGRQRRLPPGEALDLVAQCLAGLEAAHAQGIIHRDIKPSNILLDSESGRAVLVDFGLVRRMGQTTQMTATGMVMGTVDYMAPEQARGQKVDGRADIYALGVLFYQMLAGRLPFKAETPTAMIFQHAYEEPFPLEEAAPDVPGPLIEIVKRMMAKRTAERYSSCADALADIQAFLEGRPLTPAASDSAMQMTGALPLFDPAGEAELAEKLARLTDGRRWRRVRGWAATMFRRHAPEFVQNLQNTTQQVDGAVAHYERRRQRLLGLHEEARGIAGDLSEQLQANVEAAAAAMQTIESATGDEQEQAALAKKRECEEHIGALKKQHTQQQGQVEEIEHQLGTADAKLAQLRSQRDVLKARLRSAEARQQLEGGHTSVKRPPWRIAAVIAAGVLLASPLLLLFPDLRKPDLVGLKPDLSGLSGNSIDTEGGWVSLFNGRDLTGWKTHPDCSGGWSVEDGLLVGRGGPDKYLFSERPDFENFHLRVEAKVNDVGDSGVFVRSEFGLSGTAWAEPFPKAYEVQLAGGNALNNDQTGTLADAGRRDLARCERILSPPDTWLTLEVIARGKRFVVRVNGEMTADCSDETWAHRKGHLALQAARVGGVAQFRKIEIKELLPDDSEDNESTILPNGWVIHKPVNLGSRVNSSANEGGLALSADGLTLFFHSNRQGGQGGDDLWMSSRASPIALFGEPVNLGSIVNCRGLDISPWLSADGLTLLFSSDRPGGQGEKDLWMSSRERAGAPFGKPANLGPNINSYYWDAAPSLSADGLTLLFHSNRPSGQGDFDLWMSSRASPDAPFNEPVNLGPTINSYRYDVTPRLSADGLTLWYSSSSPGGHGGLDLWVSSRASLGELFGKPVNLGPIINSNSNEGSPALSPDGKMLFFESNSPGGQGGSDLWMASIVLPESKAEKVWSEIPPEMDETPKPKAEKVWPEVPPATHRLPNGWRIGKSVNLGPTVNSIAREGGPALSADDLTLFFHSNRSGGPGGMDIWMSRRPRVSDPFGEPVNLDPPVNCRGWDSSPSLSADGLTLLFSSDRSGGQGGPDIWMSRRPRVSEPFDEPVNLGPRVNSSEKDDDAVLSADGLTLLFSSTRKLERQAHGQINWFLWMSSRASTSTPFGTPVSLGPTINHPGWYQSNRSPSLSADGLTLWYASNRPGGRGDLDLWMSSRARVSDPFGEPVNLGPNINSGACEVCPAPSHDGKTLFFESPRPGRQGGWDLWMARIEQRGVPTTEKVSGTVPETPARLDARESSQQRAVAEIEKLGGRLLTPGFRASWAPDGKRFAFSKQPWTRGIGIYHVETGQITDLVAPGRDPVFSPDGRLIAYVKAYGGTEEVWLADSSGKNPRKLAHGGYPHWSGDAKTLYFQSRNQGKLMAARFYTDDPEISEVLDMSWWYPAVSPNGKQVAYRDGNQLIIAEVPTGNVVKKWTLPAGRGLLPAWSPDGKLLGYGGYGHGEDMGLWIVNVEDGRALRLAGGSFTMPGWSPGGSKLTFDLRTRKGWELWTLETKALKALAPVKLSEPPRPTPAVRPGG